MDNIKSNTSLFFQDKVRTATIIAVIFHLVGLIGILIFKNDVIAKTSALHLLLMLVLIIYTHESINRAFIFFLIIIAVTGLIIEMIGTNTGYLFGNYSYGNILGPAIKNVPWVIGINWFMVIYCCGTTMSILMNKLYTKLTNTDQSQNPIIKKLSLIIDGATLALLLDWLMEPVAIHLGYWKWNIDGTVPLYNYICWFVFSILFLWIFQKLNFNKQNKFGLHLLLIQAMFFLILRTFL